jgi:peptidoglycan/xylan/chitin deacetylase (PgdA/CDA1 family)
MPRDMVGYAGRPPAFCWPNDARLAVNIVLNYEEGSQRNALDGDVDVEHLAEATYVVPEGERNLFMESTDEFGSRVGVWRVLDLLDEYDIRPTVFATAVALQRNPEVTRAFLERGCEIVGHGYRWVPHIGLTREQEREQIRLGVTELEKLTAQKVLGWFTRPPNTVHTRELLAEQGLLYDSGAVNDDIPYYDTVLGRPFLIVPYSLDVNDIKFWKGQFFTGDDFASYGRDSFDTLYAESARTPRMMSVGLHARVMGRPGRIGGLRRLLEHIRGFDDVWIARRDEIARMWATTFPQPGLWNWDGDGAGR